MTDLAKRARAAAPAFFALLALCVCLAPAAFAADKSRINNIYITAGLERDGSAVVEETWDMVINGGTENFKQLFDMKTESISDFSVSENGVPYQFVPNWDVKASRAQKAGKCGINMTGKGPELCWGVGPENGRHVYNIRYRLHDVVTLHADTDGPAKAALYWQFITKKFQRAKHVSLRVVPPDSIGSDHHFWIFGFDGEVKVTSVDYTITANDVKEGHFVELALIMPASGFPPAKMSEYPKLAAIRGNGPSGDAMGHFRSEAPKASASDMLHLYINRAILFVFFSAFLFAFSSIRGSSPRRGIKRQPPRSVPPEETLEAIAHLLTVVYRLPEMLNTFMITWIYKKHIRIEPGGDGQICLLSRPARFEGLCERRYFNVAAEAITKPEGTLIKAYRRNLRNYQSEALQNIDGDFVKKSPGYCLERGWIDESRKKRSPRGIVPYLLSFLATVFISPGFLLLLPAFAVRRHIFPGEPRSKYGKLTAEGRETLASVLGFAAYLSNYSLLEKRGTEHIELWDSWMAFANLLGIADKLEREFSKINPSYRSDSECSVYIHSDAYRGSSRRAYSPSSSGGGGSGSSGGGGGGSGGGGGGGTR